MQVYTKYKNFIFASAQPINPADFEYDRKDYIPNYYYEVTVKQFRRFPDLAYAIKNSIFPDGNIWVSSKGVTVIDGCNGQYAKRYENVIKFTPREFTNILKDLNPTWQVCLPDQP